MLWDWSDFRGQLARRLAALPIRHRAAFAARCAERQYGTYVHFARSDPGLRPDVLRLAIDRCWDFVRGDEIPVGELAGLKEAVDQLIPNLDEDRSPFASLILDSTATVSYMIAVCLTGSIEDAVFAGECARNAVDEWIIWDVVPPRDDLPDGMIAIAPEDLRGLNEAIDRHPLMARELQRQEEDLLYLADRETMTNREWETLRRSSGSGTKSNLDLG